MHGNRICPGGTALLGVVLDGGAFLKPDASAKIKLDSPYPFAYPLEQPLCLF